MNAFAALEATKGPCALFETPAASGAGPGLTLLARDPRAIAISDATGTRILSDGRTRHVDLGPLQAVRALLAETRPGRWPEEGGVVGALAYEAARPGRSTGGTPLLVALQVDRLTLLENGQLLAAAPRAASHLPEQQPGPGPAACEPPSLPIQLPRWSSLSRADYHARVQEIQERIAAGDIYQANLSQRFRIPWPSDGLRLYRELRRVSPAPFSGYLRAAGLEIVSASPERLLSVEGRTITTRPIAGTRPRGSDPEQDGALARELILSEKERAEHLMLVDLARNDLGRVAELGSVRVDELMRLEAYSHVRHIVSDVSARLLPGRDAIDALEALFPGGTITGVPKLRCMEILDAVEPVPRGFYTGSLFYATPSGRLDANILIRSAVVTPGNVDFHAGGGIVADSDPEREYEETLHKAEALRLALDAALGWGPGPARRP
jgi:para-aminobenzoate synthetase component 1